MEIVELKPGDLIPYQFNNKIHDITQVDRIANSIKEFWFIQPIVIDKNNIVVIGHGRLEAAKKLGLDTVPCLYVENLTDTQVKKLRILDNKLNESERDIPNLKLELDELDNLNIGDIELEINDLFPELWENVEEEENDVEEVEEIEAQTAKIAGGGDLYQLWTHLLYCGDSTKTESIYELLKGELVDMVFTDPPYNTGITKEKAKKGIWLTGFFNDSYTDEERQKFMEDFTAQAYGALKEDSVAYICLDRRRNYELIPHIKNHFTLSNTIVRDKVVHGLGSDYKYTYELINVCKKGKPTLNTHQGDKEYQDIRHIQRKIGKDEDHATKKPIELCARAIRHGSKKGDKVLDIFGGSGSTLLACEQLGRNCYMIELDPGYIEVIIKRFNKLNPTAEIKCLNRDVDINEILKE